MATKAEKIENYFNRLNLKMPTSFVECWPSTQAFDAEEIRRQKFQEDTI